jgi:hypothetical protein
MSERSVFRLKSNLIELEIEDELFVLDVADGDLLENIDMFAKEAIKVADELRECEDFRVAIKDATQFCVDAINTLLGDDNACNRIFKERKVSYYDCLDILSFIFAEVKSFSDEKENKYLNRARRRANQSGNNKQ